jgi:hypothetical protein
MYLCILFYFLFCIGVGLKNFFGKRLGKSKERVGPKLRGEKPKSGGEKICLFIITSKYVRVLQQEN